MEGEGEEHEHGPGDGRHEHQPHDTPAPHQPHRRRLRLQRRFRATAACDRTLRSERGNDRCARLAGSGRFSAYLCFASPLLPPPPQQPLPCEAGADLGFGWRQDRSPVRIGPMRRQTREERARKLEPWNPVLCCSLRECVTRKTEQVSFHLAWNH